MAETTILKSAEEICKHYHWSRKTFLELCKLGLPVRKIGKCWYGVDTAIQDWFMRFTSEGKAENSDRAQ